MKTFDDYQLEALKFAIYPEEQQLVYPALGLASECGEVCDKVKKLIRDRKNGFDDLNNDDRLAIVKEIGDVLWYASVLCYELDFNLSDAATINLHKLSSRQKRNKLTGSGDDR